MLAKLALRNVRRSVRDYAIYFVTLVFGVAVFYAFNSVKSQSILFDMEAAGSADLFDLTGQFLSMFSVLIACVLGFLIIYANRFLIRRRKQEFGTYLLLGMRAGQVSFIVLMETVCVGLASLAVGLALGLAVSQGMSFLTAGLFSLPMQRYRFVFSMDAFALTLACFAVIFVIVGLFNTLSIRRYKLVNLLSARSQNERFRVRNPWISLGGFAVSAALLALAYATLINNGLVSLDAEFARATALMLVGTFLFFWSVAGFALVVIERTRGVYFKGLAMFTMRQIASKMNTAFISLSMVCVMLFFSLTVFSSGMGLARVFTGSVEEGTLYDATLSAPVYMNAGGIHDPETLASMSEEDRAAQDAADERAAAVRADAEEWDWDIAAKLSAAAPEWNDFVAGAYQVDLYADPSTTYGALLDEHHIELDALGTDVGGSSTLESLRAQGVFVIGVSQFNALAAATGRTQVELSEGEYAVNNVVAVTESLSSVMAKEGATVDVAGVALAATGQMVSQPLLVQSFLSDGAELIVPDSVIDALRARGEAPHESELNLMYSVGRSEGDEMVDRVLAKVSPNDPVNGLYGWSYEPKPWPVMIVTTANEVISQASGMNMLISYLALYIGFVFLVATAAILAIQQLSEASDSLPRYRMLAEIGCDRRMIMRSLRAQVLVYFLAPLALAVSHTACAVGVLSKSLFDQLGVSVATPALTTALLAVAIYGGYLAVTYFTSRGIVRASLGKKLLG